MNEQLPDDYLLAAERRARVFQGAWTGTAGALGADVVRLLQERKHLLTELDEMRTTRNRGPVDLANGGAADAACDEPPTASVADEPAAGDADWILRGDRELKESRAAGPRLTGDGLLGGDAPPAETLLERALAAVRERRTSYGGPGIHFARTVGMINAAFAGVLRRPLTPSDWAVIMTLDKVARAMGPTGDPRHATADTAVDLAGYAGCFFEVQSDTP